MIKHKRQNGHKVNLKKAELSNLFNRSFVYFVANSNFLDDDWKKDYRSRFMGSEDLLEELLDLQGFNIDSDLNENKKNRKSTYRGRHELINQFDLNKEMFVCLPILVEKDVLVGVSSNLMQAQKWLTDNLNTLINSKGTTFNIKKPRGCSIKKYLFEVVQCFNDVLNTDWINLKLSPHWSYYFLSKDIKAKYCCDKEKKEQQPEYRGPNPQRIIESRLRLKTMRVSRNESVRIKKKTPKKRSKLL